MSALSVELRAALDEARAIDPRPGAVAMWDRIEQLAEASADPAGALDAYCRRYLAAAESIIAEQNAQAPAAAQ